MLIELFFALGDAAAHEGVEENVGGAEDYYPEAGHVAEGVSHEALDGHHYGATEYHGHEDAGGDGGVLAEAFNCHIEDGAPHHAGAETYEEEGEDAYGDGLPDEGEGAPVDAGEVGLYVAGGEHTEEHEHEGGSADGGNHGTGANLVADGGTYEATDEHHEPVNGNDETYGGYGNTVFNEHEVYEVGHTYFNTHVQEDGESTEGEVAVAHSALDEVNTNGGLLGLFNLGEADNDESDDEDGEGNHQGGGSIGDASLGDVSNEGAHKNVAANGSRAVEYATNLDELVTLVAATTEEVEHGVNNAVEDTHAETSDKGTGEVNAEYETEVTFSVNLAAEPLDENTGSADGEADESSLLVAELGDEHAGGDTHDEVGDEVAVVTNLGEHIGDFAGLVLNDGGHR